MPFDEDQNTDTQNKRQVQFVIECLEISCFLLNDIRKSRVVPQQNREENATPALISEIEHRTKSDNMIPVTPLDQTNRMLASANTLQIQVFNYKRVVSIHTL